MSEKQAIAVNVSFGAKQESGQMTGYDRRYTGSSTRLPLCCRI